MRQIIRTTCSIALVLFVGSASPAGAQTVTVEGSGGFTVPSGELSDLADGSASLQVAAGYRAHPRLLVRALGSVELLSGKDVSEVGFPASTPDVELWSAGAGVEGLVTPPDWNWFGTVTASGMATSFNTAVFDELVFDPVSEELVGDFSQTYFTAALGVSVGYEVGSRLRAFVSAEWRQMFADEEDTAVFGELSPEVEAFDSAAWFPLRAGIRYAFSL